MILADHNYEDAESCAGQYGAFWMDLDGGRCMRLTYKPSEANKYPTAGAVSHEAHQARQRSRIVD